MTRDLGEILKGIQCCMTEPELIEDCRVIGCPYIDKKDCMIEIMKDAQPYLAVLKRLEDTAPWKE